MLNINEVRLLGRLADDPTFGKAANGRDYMRVRVITSRSFKVEGGEWEERATGHSVVTFDRYRIQHGRDRLRKGALVYVEGENTESRREENGQTVYKRGVLVPIGRKLHSLEGRAEASGRDREEQQAQSQDQRRANVPDGPPINGQNPLDQHDYSDEIPF